ncbi:MAG: hypothetical protein WCJ30_00530 [Deltaproteobacteria bacterium]
MRINRPGRGVVACACLALAGLAACSPAPRPRVAVPIPVPVVVVGQAPSPSPPPEPSSPPPSAPEEPPPPGCTLAEGQRVIGHGALAAAGSNITTVASHTVVAWAAGSGATGLDAHGVEIDPSGAAVTDVVPVVAGGRTVAIGRVSAAAVGPGGALRLVADRRFREGLAEYVECGTSRGQVARLTEEGGYEDDGTAIHFDLAECRSIVAGERPFVLGAYPANDEDLFAGMVYLHAQSWGAPTDQFTRVWSYSQSQDVFDRDMPWLRAIALDAPAEPVGVALPGGGYAVAWRHRGVVYLQWLGANLAPRGAPRAISTRATQPGLPQLAVNGREVLAVFAQRAGERARWSVHAVRLPFDGNALPHVVLAQGPEDAIAPAAIAVEGSEGWAVTWSQSAPPVRRGVDRPLHSRFWLQH